MKKEKLTGETIGIKQPNQDYNFNSGNEKTFFCHATIEYWFKKDMSKIKDISKFAYNQYLKLCKKNKVEFVERPRDEHTETIDTYFVLDNKERFFRGRSNISPQMGFWNKDKEITNLFVDKLKFLETNFKCSSNRMFDFLKDFKKNQWTFDHQIELIYYENIEVWEFHGNLKEVSHTFSFKIYDDNLRKEIETYLLSLSYIKKTKKNNLVHVTNTKNYY